MAGTKHLHLCDEKRTRTTRVLWLCLIVLVLCVLTLAAVHGIGECPYDHDGCPLCKLAHGAQLETPVQLVSLAVPLIHFAVSHVESPCLEDTVIGKGWSRAPPALICVGL